MWTSQNSANCCFETRKGASRFNHYSFDLKILLCQGEILCLGTGGSICCWPTNWLHKVWFAIWIKKYFGITVGLGYLAVLLRSEFNILKDLLHLSTYKIPPQTIMMQYTWGGKGIAENAHLNTLVVLTIFFSFFFFFFKFFFFFFFCQIMYHL